MSVKIKLHNFFSNLNLNEFYQSLQIELIEQFINFIQLRHFVFPMFQQKLTFCLNFGLTVKKTDGLNKSIRIFIFHFFPSLFVNDHF